MGSGFLGSHSGACPTPGEPKEKRSDAKEVASQWRAWGGRRGQWLPSCGWGLDRAIPARHSIRGLGSGSVSNGLGGFRSGAGRARNRLT